MVYFFYTLSMSLQETIRSDMVVAMKTKDEVRLRVLRGLLSLFTQELVATKRTPRDMLSDDEVITLIKRSVKQRKEASTQFRNGGREDLSVNEEKEADILETYLPEALGKDAVKAVVEAKMAELGSDEKVEIGKLIGAVMVELKGQADGKMVKEIIEEAISSR